MRSITVVVLVFIYNNLMCQVLPDTLMQSERLVSYDGYFLLTEMWSNRKDSTTTTFFFFENGRAAAISTSKEDNPILKYNEMDDTQKEEYCNALNWGRFYVHCDTVHVRVSWNMYGKLGQRNYNDYFFILRNGKLIYYWEEKVKISRRLRKTKILKTRNDVLKFVKSKQRPYCTKSPSSWTKCKCVEE